MGTTVWLKSFCIVASSHHTDSNSSGRAPSWPMRLPRKLACAVTARVKRSTHCVKIGSSGKQVGMCSYLIPRRFIAEVIMNCPHQASEGRLPSASILPLVAKCSTGMGFGRCAMIPPTAEVSLPKVIPPTITPLISLSLKSFNVFAASARLRTTPPFVIFASGTTISRPGTAAIALRQRARMSAAHSSPKGTR